MPFLILTLLVTLRQQPSLQELRTILDATVRVDLLEGRFLHVSLDTLPTSARGSILTNRYPRIFEYLVQHQLPTERQFTGVANSADRRSVFIQNLLADSAVVHNITAYLSSTTGRHNQPRSDPTSATITSAEVKAIAARFFYPLVTKDNKFQFYRCAGINGIEGLGDRRNPAVEAFAFWAMAPSIFDADSASRDAVALAADFARAKTAFRRVVEAADFAPDRITSARMDFYATMEKSPALQRIVERAYHSAADRLPFRIVTVNQRPRKAG